MLADNVGARAPRAPTTPSLLSHSAPLSAAHVSHGTATVASSSVWHGVRAVPVSVAAPARPRSRLVGALSGALVSARVSDVVFARFRNKRVSVTAISETQVTYIVSQVHRVLVPLNESTACRRPFVNTKRGLI